MRICYVPDLDRLCIELHFSPNQYKTTREVGYGTTVDLDDRGDPLRIDIKWASERYPREELEKLPTCEAPS